MKLPISTRGLIAGAGLLALPAAASLAAAHPLISAGMVGVGLLAGRGALMGDKAFKGIMPNPLQMTGFNKDIGKVFGTAALGAAAAKEVSSAASPGVETALDAELKAMGFSQGKSSLSINASKFRNEPGYMGNGYLPNTGVAGLRGLSGKRLRNAYAKSQARMGRMLDNSIEGKGSLYKRGFFNRGVSKKDIQRHAILTLHMGRDGMIGDEEIISEFNNMDLLISGLSRPDQREFHGLYSKVISPITKVKPDNLVRTGMPLRGRRIEPGKKVETTTSSTAVATTEKTGLAAQAKQIYTHMMGG